MVSECFLVAGRIDPNDSAASWHSGMAQHFADLNNERGNAAFECGHLLTAQKNWLRAINYYQASTYRTLDAADTKRQALAVEATRNLRPALHRASRLPATRAETSWLEGHFCWKVATSCPPQPLPAQRPSVVCTRRPRDIAKKNTLQGRTLRPRAGNVVAGRGSPLAQPRRRIEEVVGSAIWKTGGRLRGFRPGDAGQC